MLVNLMSDQSKDNDLYIPDFNSHRKFYWDQISQEIKRSNSISYRNIIEDILWRDIRNIAKEDEELQKLLDRVKIIYYLKKTNGSKT